MTLHVVSLTFQVYETQDLIKNIEPHTKICHYAWPSCISLSTFPSALAKFIFHDYERVQSIWSLAMDGGPEQARLLQQNMRNWRNIYVQQLSRTRSSGFSPCSTRHRMQRLPGWQWHHGWFGGREGRQYMMKSFKAPRPLTSSSHILFPSLRCYQATQR